ncbi:MAG: hypothetical protein ACI4QG_00445 [Candidatus Cryptobacteroides sp.]
MEKTQDEILSEISGMIADIRRQLDVLTGKLEELGNLSGGAACEYRESLPDSVADGEVLTEYASEDGVSEGIAQENPVQETPVQEEPLLAIDDSEEAIELDVPFIDDSKPAVVDALMRSRAWMNDIPGSSVQDIRSAISLNDRLYFIKNLFSDDPTLFQSVVADLNGYSSFEDAARWLLDRFKGWDPDSDVVYRFMMAVRRKLK